MKLQHKPGHWNSYITPELYSQQSGKLSEVQICGDSLCFLESRPHEKGRSVLMIAEGQGRVKELLPDSISLRTRAQEYGGGSYLLTEDYIFYVLDSDQNIYVFNRSTKKISALTHNNTPEKIHFRFADFCWDSLRQRLICVCEDLLQSHQYPQSRIVALPLDPQHEIKILAEGADFYSNPRIHHHKLSYLLWNHPNMPWDSTECHCALLDDAGNVIQTKKIAGGKNESIFQPQWSPSGDLFFVSDKNNWWNLYYLPEGSNAKVKALEICPIEAEFATPQWTFGMSTYGFIDHENLFCCFSQKGSWKLGIINFKTDNSETKITLLDDADFPAFRDISSVQATSGKAYFLAGTATQNICLWSYQKDVPDKKYFSRLFPKTKSPLKAADISHAKAISFPTADGETAYAFYYPPQNSLEKNNSELPPLMVICHGGPTGATESSLSLKIQFWTHRGFAVVDVNYRGSTGYGRRYRNRLHHHWGITDVIDVCSAAHYLTAQGLADKDRVVIRGSSAGGFTVLAALCFGDRYFSKPIFCAGASYYGIGDLTALARDTHKFEAHYLDQLIGPYPAQESLYHERSPIYQLDNMNCPVIVFQGLKDKVVPPQQAEDLVKALQEKSIPTEYISFADEGHGFRNAKNIEKAIKKELAFYLKVFKKRRLG